MGNSVDGYYALQLKCAQSNSVILDSLKLIFNHCLQVSIFVITVNFLQADTSIKRTPVKTDTFRKFLSAPIGNAVRPRSIRQTPLKTDSEQYFFVPSALCTFLKRTVVR